MAELIQPSFAKGEIAPDLYGRVDVTAYQVGLRTALNAICHPYGGVSNRPGTVYLGPVKEHSYAPLLANFQFKTTDSYILEFGNQYVRFLRNDAHVLEDNKTITAVTNANPGVFTITSHGFSNGDELFFSSVVGMPYLNQKRFVIANVTTDTFTIEDQVSLVNIDTTSLGTFVSGQAARVYTLATPYTSADLEELKWVQNADVMTLTHRNYPPYELGRVSNANWTLTQIAFGPSITFPTGLAVSVGTTGAVTYSYKVTAVKADTLEESLSGTNTTSFGISGITNANPGVVTTASAHGYSNGQEVYIDGVVGMTEVNKHRFIIANVTSTTFSIGVDTTSYGTYVADAGDSVWQTFITITNGAATANNTISWTAVDDATEYRVYKFSGGAYGLIGTPTATSFKDANFAADGTSSPPRSLDPFGSGIYPICCTYYEQRRVFGGSNDAPDTEWFTQVGNTSNMNAASPIGDSDSFSATLTAAEVNEIRNFIPQTSLLCFTSGAEWRVDSGLSDSFTVSTIKQKPQSNWGISHLKPLVINSTIIFIPGNQKGVRSFDYSYTIDKYTGVDLAILAPHLMDNNQITGWCYASTPDPRMFFVRDDGLLLTLTYNQEQDVTAWTRCTTDGNFERVQSLRNPSGNTDLEDSVYFVVQRFINGNTVRYIEKLHTRQFTAVEECFFVDCGLSYDDPAAITNIVFGATTLIQAPAHGFSDGDLVDLRDILWETTWDDSFNVVTPDQLNAFRYTISNVTTDTFTISVDSTSYARYISGGTARKAVNSFSGLDHLEGEAVVALADGNVVTNLTVTNGTVTFNRMYGIVHIGKRYITDIETLNIEAPQGTIQGKLKKISKVVVRFKDSRGLLIGPDSSDLVEMPQREFEVYGEPTQLLTGDKEIEQYPSWGTNGRTFMRQKDPLPLTILAVMPTIMVEDN